MEDQPDTRMFANMRYDLLRKAGEMCVDIGEAVVIAKGIALETGDEGIDERIALLCRHVVLHRVHAMLAVDDRLIEQAIEIGRKKQPVIDVDDCVALGADVRTDMRCCRKAANGIPELGRTATRFVEMID